MKTYTAKDVSGFGRFSIELPGGLTAEIRVERADDMGPPWEEHEGHGEVSKWTSRDKRAGEWVLASDCGSHRYYDAAGAMKTARKYGWGISESDAAALAAKLGRTPTKGEICAAAVLADFEHLRDWCENRWEWLWYSVEVTDAHGNAVADDSCGGFDGDTEYFRGQIADCLNRAQEQNAKEETERAHWEARDVETVNV